MAYTNEELKLAQEYVLKKKQYQNTEFYNANDKKKKRLIAEQSALGEEDLDYKILDGTADETAVKQYAMYRQNQKAKAENALKEKNEKNSVESWRRGEANVIAVMGDTYNEVDPAYMGGAKENLPTKLDSDLSEPNKISVSNSSNQNGVYEEYGNNYFELITYDNIF